MARLQRETNLFGKFEIAYQRSTISGMQLALSIVLSVFLCPNVFATYFADHPYGEYMGDHVKTGAVAQIACSKLSFGRADGTAVHLGFGHVLAAGHGKPLFDLCDEVVYGRPNLNGTMDGVKLSPSYRCNLSLDYCLFSVVDSSEIPKGKLDLSNSPPPVKESLYFIGFPEDSTKNVTTATGKIVLDEEVDAEFSGVTVPLYANSISWFAGGSNSPVFSSDPGLMVLFQNGFTRSLLWGYVTTEAEAIKLMETEKVLNFNFGIAAKRIAADLIAKYGRCFEEKKDRVIAVSPL